MAKIGAVWEKLEGDAWGFPSITLAGKVNIDGVEYWLNLYPAKRTDKKSPAYNVYLKPVKEVLGA